MRHFVAGALTAHSFVLQNLYALILAQDADPASAARRTGAEMMRQFEDLPVTNPKPVPGDEAHRILQHGLHTLERFWSNVEERLGGM